MLRSHDIENFFQRDLFFFIDFLIFLYFKIFSGCLTFHQLLSPIPSLASVGA